MAAQRGYYRQLRRDPVQLHSLAEVVGSFPEINILVEGNQRFRDSVASSSNPNLLKEQTDAGQNPGFLFLGCRYVSFAENLGCVLIQKLAHLVTPVCLKAPSLMRTPERSSLNAT